MAYRLKLSRRALREVGAAREWYESQSKGLGDEFVGELEAIFTRLKESPFIYAEVLPKVHRAFTTRFPYGLFYAVHNDLVQILAVIHHARNPSDWPQSINEPTRTQPPK